MPTRRSIRGLSSGGRHIPSAKSFNISTMKNAFMVALLLAVPGAALAQQPTPPSGDAVFTRACASCHQAAQAQTGQTKVPTPDDLRAYTPEAIVNALTNGKMAVQGATLTTADRVAVAQ